MRLLAAVLVMLLAGPAYAQLPQPIPPPPPEPTTSELKALMVQSQQRIELVLEYQRLATDFQKVQWDRLEQTEERQDKRLEELIQQVLVQLNAGKPQGMSGSDWTKLLTMILTTTMAAIGAFK